MANSMRRFLAALVVVLGIGLIIGGIATDKGGAIVVGIIVGGVATQRWIAMKGQDGARKRQ